jgi:hypothetical protein
LEILGSKSPTRTPWSNVWMKGGGGPARAGARNGLSDLSIIWVKENITQRRISIPTCDVLRHELR